MSLKHLFARYSKSINPPYISDDNLTLGLTVLMIVTLPVAVYLAFQSTEYRGRVTTSTATAVPVPTVSNSLAVVITSPVAGSTLPAAGNVNVSTSASYSGGILDISLSVDGTLLQTCIVPVNKQTKLYPTTFTCSAIWNMKGVSSGSHIISASVTSSSIPIQTALTSAIVSK